MDTKPLSPLAKLALQQILEDNAKRFMEAARVAAANDAIDLTQSWRLDIPTMAWIKDLPPSAE